MSESNESGWTFTRDATVDTDRYDRVNSPVKFYILELCDSLGRVDLHDVAEGCGMPESYAASRLVRYARKGLLYRESGDPPGRSTFHLTVHGQDRLAYFRGRV